MFKAERPKLEITDSKNHNRQLWSVGKSVS